MDIETVIGLEIHVQLSTKSKVFCGDSTIFGDSPNSAVGAVSLALPGTLPRLNRTAARAAATMGFALGARVQERSFFDRKNYFYTDLPKGYQITQDAQPVAVGGGILVKNEAGETRFIRIHHLHLEEDAGKSLHDQAPDETCVDLNRAGIPLIEIVTEPDLRSAAEAASLMEEIRRLVRWIGISDGNMEEGSLRCDVNVSVRPRVQEAFGNRCEIKNVNSMRFARKAIEFEVQRQSAILKQGGTVLQQTRGYDPLTDSTFAQRDKENVQDYRYFPEPDLPPVVFTKDTLADMEAEMPELPQVMEQRFMGEYALQAKEAALLTQDKATAGYFDDLMQQTPTESHRAMANLVIQKLLPQANEQNIALGAAEFPSVSSMLAFLDLIKKGDISHSVAYQKLWPALMEQPHTAPAELATQLNLLLEKDFDGMETEARLILEKYPDKTESYRKGKKGLLGFFMGELMKSGKGKYEPKAATEVLERLLG